MIPSLIEIYNFVSSSPVVSPQQPLTLIITLQNFNVVSLQV